MVPSLPFFVEPPPAPVICLLDPGVPSEPTFREAVIPAGHRGVFIPIPPTDPRYHDALRGLLHASRGHLLGCRLLDARTGTLEIELLVWGALIRTVRVLHVAVFVSTRTHRTA